MESEHYSLRGLSRRRFVAHSAALSAMLPSLARSGQSGGGRKGSQLAYVGTYSSPQGPEGSRGRGQGVYVFEMNLSTGALSQREVFEDGSNPAWLALDPSGKYLYAANEINDFQVTNS